MISYINDLTSVPMIRLIILIFFFLFILGILTQIFDFIGVRFEIVQTYMIWIVVLLTFIVFLPQQSSNLHGIVL
jgi:hypothetical protein